MKTTEDFKVFVASGIIGDAPAEFYFNNETEFLYVGNKAISMSHLIEYDLGKFREKNEIEENALRRIDFETLKLKSVRIESNLVQCRYQHNPLEWTIRGFYGRLMVDFFEGHSDPYKLVAVKCPECCED